MITNLIGLLSAVIFNLNALGGAQSPISFDDVYSAAKQPAKKTNAKADSKDACAKPKENLIVVNFTSTKLTLYIANKKAGTVPALDQKNFKNVLPPGANLVQLTTGAKEVVHEAEFQIIADGKKTCKKNQTIILK